MYSDRDQFGSSQVSVDQFGSIQVSAIQTSIPQISIGQVSRGQDSNLQIGITQIGTTQVDETHISSSQISSAQVNAAEIIPSGIVFSNFGNIELETTQIKTAKISFPSSILPVQLFSIHNLSPASINTYKDNPLTLFDPTFNINLQITDFPTGQLAVREAWRSLSPTNPIRPTRSNGGTILIDHNANGLGWFIDPTPWENSEFTQTLTDTAFRATTGEVAGKYDLLYNSVITNLSINRSLKHLHYDW